MYENTSETEYEPNDYEHLAPLITMYLFVSIIGTIGNISLMAALLSVGASRLRTPQLLSVCVADLLVCVVSAPLAACRAASLHAMPCLFARYIESLPVAASTLSVVAVAADRYATVRRGRGASVCVRPLLVVLAVWAVAMLLGTASAVAECTGWAQLGAAHAMLAFVVPVAAVARWHGAVRARLTALSLTARAAHGELPLPVPLLQRPSHVIIVAGVGPRSRRAAVDGGVRPSLLGPQPPTSTLRSRRRLGNVLLGAAAIFAACWAPHAGLALAGAAGLGAPAFAPYALLLGHAHSAINAAAYWALNRNALTAACAAWRLPQLRVREERPSSTNEAALGAFHPRLARRAPSPRPPPSSYLY